jgi:riboflavin biosynthesis pyrimidine reductase
VGAETLEPFDVLFEADGLPAVELPSELRLIHGGDLGFDEPRVYANFVATLDGVVAIPSLPNSNEVISGRSKADHFLMGVLRAFADVVLIGAGVLHAAPQGTWRPEKVYPPAAEAFAELRRKLGRPAAPEIAVLTGLGSIDPGHPLLESGALVLTSETGADRLAPELPAASTVVVLGNESRFDGGTVVSALRDRGHRLILSEAGPHVFGSLLDAGAVDELFLTTSPFLAGQAGDVSRLQLVEGADLVPLVEGRMLSVRRHGDHLFTRYELGGRRSR